MDQVNELMEAAFNGNVKFMQEMFESGVSPDSAHPISGHTLLQLACETDNISSIKCLLVNGANPNKRFTKTSRVDNRTLCKNGIALMYARSIAAIDLLIDFGADLSVKDDDNNSVQDWFVRSKAQELANYVDKIAKP